MKVLVTGGAGFIGSHLVEALLGEGHQVVAIDDLSTGKRSNLKEAEKNDSFEFIEGTILNVQQLRKAFHGVELVYHLAAAVGVKYVIDNPLTSIHTNVLGTENVLSIANEQQSKVVFASTSEVYGKNEAETLSEDTYRILGATDVTRWSYASAKALDEFVCFGYYRHHGLPVVVARLFNTTGERQSGRYGMVLPRFITQAMNDKPITVYGTGEQVRAFTDVSDTVRALVGLGFSEEAVGQTFNIGNEKNVTSINNLAERVKEVLDSKSEIVTVSYEEAYDKGFEDMMRRVPNTQKIKKAIGFEATLSLDEIIEKLHTSLKAENGLHQNL